MPDARYKGWMMSQSFSSPDPFSPHEDDTLRSLLRSILASVPDAMIVINEIGDIVAFSAAAERLFGYSAEDVAGKNIRVLMGGRDRSYHDTYISNYLETGEKQIIGIRRVVEARLANGDTIPVELKIGEAKLGEHRLFTGYVRDISKKQATEHRMRQMQAELGNFSRLSAVGTMASAMAHELNQPLTAVANYLEAARDLLTTPDPQTLEVVKEALDEASQQSIRAGQIIRRLRDYVSRGEIETRPTDIKTVLNDAASLAKIGVDGPMPRIVDSAPESLPEVMADRVQIQQVLVNLIRNASEAMGDMDQPMVWLEAELVDDGNEIEIRVRDNGPGLPEEADGEPFQPFNSSKPTGMGLGLSICQTIVDGHGGDMWCKSETGQGATFGFRLKTAPEKAVE